MAQIDLPNERLQGHLEPGVAPRSTCNHSPRRPAPRFGQSRPGGRRARDANARRVTRMQRAERHNLRKVVWRPRPELNRSTRFCRPLRNHSATWPLPSSGVGDPSPGARWRPAIQERVMAGNRAGLGCGTLGLRPLPRGGLAWRLGAMPCILRPLAAKRRRQHSPGTRR
jgi:hypothetical protein